MFLRNSSAVSVRCIRAGTAFSCLLWRMRKTWSHRPRFMQAGEYVILPFCPGDFFTRLCRASGFFRGQALRRRSSPCSGEQAFESCLEALRGIIRRSLENGHGSMRFWAIVVSGFSRGMVVKKPRGSHAIFGEHESDLGYRKKPRTEVTSAFSGLCCRLSPLQRPSCTGRRNASVRERY